MKLKLILAAMIVATSALAEDAPSVTPAPEKAAPTPAQAAPQRFYLEVEQADLNAISQALMELPKRVADPLILKLQGQLQAQEPIKDAADKAEKARKRK